MGWSFDRVTARRSFGAAQGRTPETRDTGFPQPKQLWVPLVGCTVRSECLVEPGDWIEKGTPLSAPQFAAPVYAPAAGSIKEIRERTLAQKGPTTCVLLIPDWSYEFPERKKPAQGHQEELIAAAAAAGIVDEFDGLPLYKKLKRFRRRGVNLLLGNAIDDDPTWRPQWQSCGKTPSGWRRA